MKSDLPGCPWETPETEQEEGLPAGLPSMPKHRQKPNSTPSSLEMFLSFEKVPWSAETRSVIVSGEA